jgi:micrococcal nuclease
MRSRFGATAALAFGVWAIASPSWADPCTASLPKAGTTFSGTVRYVGDGDGLCVGKTTDPREWIEVRLADFYAPELHEPGGREAKAALERISQGRPIVCVAGRRTYDRVVGRCEIDGREIGDLMRRAGVSEGGNGSR